MQRNNLIIPKHSHTHTILIGTESEYWPNSDEVFFDGVIEEEPELRYLPVDVFYIPLNQIS